MTSTAELVLSVLSAKRVKKTGAGQYQSNNPFRESSDSMGFLLVIEPDGEL